LKLEFAHFLGSVKLTNRKALVACLSLGFFVRRSEGWRNPISIAEFKAFPLLSFLIPLIVRVMPKNLMRQSFCPVIWGNLGGCCIFFGVSV
jgi:hypothetical protein